MARRGPPVFKARNIGEIARRRDVIDQRIEPHIAHVIFVKGKRNPPFQTRLGPRNAQIAQGLTQEPENLVAPLFRANKAGMRLDVFDEPVLVFAHSKKVILLGYFHRGAPAIRTIARNQIFFRQNRSSGMQYQPS